MQCARIIIFKVF